MSEDLSAKLTKEKLRSRVENAYEAYRRQGPLSADRLMSAVRALARVKVYHLEHDFKDFGSVETADDWAQDVCLNVWKQLKGYVHVKGKFKGMFKKFEGTGSEFYSNVHAAAFNRGVDAFEMLKEESETKVNLYVEKEDEEGDRHEQENPELCGACEFNIHIPASVQGLDLDIVKLMVAGRKPEEIAVELHMTTGAIATRLSRLRDRIERGDHAQPTLVQYASRIDANNAFDLTIPAAQTAKLSGGHMKSGAYSFNDGGKATHTANPFRVKPSLTDFVIDVENTARKVLTPGEFLYFRRTYFSESNGAERIPRVDAIVRCKVGTALIEFGIYPLSLYMNRADLDVRKAASAKMPIGSTHLKQAISTACAEWAA